MSGIEKNTPLRLSLYEIKETGFSIRPDLRESDIEKIEWMIGFRPILNNEADIISIEVRSNAIITDTNVEVASCSILVSFNVDNLNSFVTIESDTRINIRDHLMLNILNASYGTLRGVMFARFSGSLLEKKPLPLIDVQELIKAARL